MNPAFLHSSSSSRCALATGACVVALGSAAVGTPLPPLGFPQTIGVQLKPNSFNVATLDQAHAMGFKVVRRGFYWNAVEKEKGVYSFADYDRQMAHAKSLGLTVVGCLFGGNKLYEDHGRGGVLTEEGRQGFAAFAAAATVRYKDQPVIWEIWNEPNVRTFWRKDGMHNTEEFAEEYSALVNTVAPAMVKANPDCFVVAGSVSNYWEPSYKWTEYCFQKGVLKSGIRGWSVHPYGVRTPEEHAIGHARTRALLVKYGAPELPMLNTERGYAVKERDEGWSGGAKDRAREYQAWHFVRQLLVDQLHGVRPSVWYEWGGEEFGLTDSDGPRPIQAALRTLVAELGGYRIARRLESDTPLNYVLLCENESGTRKLVAWTAPPSGASPDDTRPHEVMIDMGAGREALAVTLGGEPRYYPVPAGAEPGRCVTVSVGAPIVVPEAAPAVIPAEAVALRLFEEGREWKFEKNTGEGSFVLGKDAEGRAVGTMTYDFSTSKTGGTPYVLATVPVEIAAGPTQILLQARTPVAQQLTFRLKDSTGQTLQFKARAKGTGQWEPIRIPLNRKLENWGGAKDGKVHFPVTSITFSVPRPNAETLTGKVEYSEAHAQ